MVCKVRKRWRGGEVLLLLPIPVPPLGEGEVGRKPPKC